jgi:hypothetical protein
MIPELQDCTIVCLFGPVSSGKTYLLHRWFQRMERGIAIDPTAELFGETYTHVWGNPREMCEFLSANPYYYRIAYHPNNVGAAFEWCANAIWQCNGTRWLICDEVHEVCSFNSTLEIASTVIRYCRHNLLGFIGASQRVSDVGKLLTSNARMVILFYTEEYRDMVAIQERWGTVVADAVKHLRPLIFNDKNKNVEQTPQAVVIVRGQGHRVIDIGDEVKIKTHKEENTQWENRLPDEPEQPMAVTQVDSSLARDTGKKEPRSPEHTSEVS